MFDMFSILGKVKEAQEKMKAIQAGLVNFTTTAEVGGGMVKATINGHKQIISIEIDNSILSDKEMVQDLTVAAVNKAIVDIENIIKAEIAKQMEGVIPNIPGLDLNSILAGR
jgi:DNA-binding YbaB/EbfC family protein